MWALVSASSHAAGDDTGFSKLLKETVPAPPAAQGKAGEHRQAQQHAPKVKQPKLVLG